MTRGKRILFNTTLVIVFAYFLFLGLIEAKGFLIPLVSAIILALMVLPLAQKLEGRRIHRGLSSFLSTLILFLIVLSFLAMVSYQVQGFTEKWPQIMETMKPQLEQGKQFVFKYTKFNLDELSQSGKNLPSMEGEQDEKAASTQSSTQKSSEQSLKSKQGEISTKQNKSGPLANQSKKTFNYLMKTLGFIGSFLLVFIYIFFLLNYRRRFRNFLLQFFPKEKKSEVKVIIHKSAKVTQQYLVGKLLLTGCLAILYAAGLGLSGVSNFILISILAALLAFLPYLGNIIGFLLALAFGFLSSGDTSVLIGILITFSVAQFVESYFLEPYVVGEKVDLHPFFVILVVVLGNSIWGIIGMLLAIPLLAIVTVVLLHIPSLHPLGFLFSKQSSAD